MGRRIKWRVAWILGAFGLGFGTTFWFSKEIFAWLIAPAGGLLSPFEGNLPIFTAPGEMFGVTLKLAGYGGVTAVFPVAVIGIYTLVRPIFTARQRRMAVVFMGAAFVLFLTGNAFVYYVMLPVGLKFLLHFGDGVAVPLISVSQYLELLIQLMFWLGIIFELPLIMYLLAKLKIVRYRRLNWLRRMVPFVALILGIILTPGTDLVNMALVAVPIVLLYEVGLFLAWLARPEDGDYLWLGSTARAIRWVVTRPHAGWRKFRFFLRRQGL